MATTRGRVVRAGGTHTDDGATPRTDPAAQIIRPAFKISAGTMMPTQPGSEKPGLQAFLDPSTIYFWRLALVAGAAMYVFGFHASLGRIRVRVGAR